MSKFDFVSAYAILAGKGKEPADCDEIEDVVVSKSGKIAKIIFIDKCTQYIFIDRKLRILFG